MQCRDAQFYLRLRRHAGDELGADTGADLDRHLAGCPACATEARAAESFDRAVSSALRRVPVPPGLREKLLTQASAHHGTVIRRRAARVAAVACSGLLALGLGFGVFSASRPKIDTNAMVASADEQIQNPDAALARWLAGQQLPAQLPEPFNTDLLVHMGTERVQGADVPVVVFRHPTEFGFAKVYIFRADGAANLEGLRDTNASLTIAKVHADARQHRGVKYAVIYTANPNDLKPFLRPPGQTARI